ncbi:diguanylate cyclase (GGDEF)-like protein [Angulomicrobium tetraedrale]|uniref:Diguanylate cyclase (GGDEF)-like protein n=1 Tax=Ancylobacter tetraedralis TaxID=217068 RepID=A0A839ZC10_9HYPH|nr:GGDEF and EAL domain-containing protein [Ancylobacter tetraedralis]MBB3772222.1 diguanylate cyclase (GGDEF)-like protein [Ancylobacter tetraedralis]
MIDKSRRGAAEPDVLAPDAVARVIGDLGAAAYRWTPPDDRMVWSAGAEAMLGLARGDHLKTGKDYDGRIASGSGLSRAEAARSSAIHGPHAGTRLFETSYCLLPPPGSFMPMLRVEDCGLGLFDADGELLRIDGMVRLVPAAFLDAAPGEGVADPMAGRVHLTRLVERKLAEAAGGDAEFGFLMVGFDRLGRLNEAYGSEIGDELIDAVGGRLREVRGSGEVLARFSDSKFGMLLSTERLALAPHFLARVNATPFRTSAGLVTASVSAGAVVAPRDGGRAAELFAHARDALRSARARGAGSFETFHAASVHAVQQRANLRFVDDMLSALGENRVSLAFQPIAATETRIVQFHEALVRVRGRDGGMYDGATIMPVADRFGLTVLLDRHSLELALAALARDADLRLSVNVSPTSIHDDVWLRILDEGTRAGRGARLIIEITEAAGILDLEVMRQRVRWIQERGVRVAMDDFGVGYTSFRSLRRLGVDLLKIDGSFICTLMESAEDRHFVRALLDLAHNLGMETVAEWVLDEPTARQLAEWGCTYLQGQLIGLAQGQPPVGDTPAPA